jgi:hypothetical protein
MTRDREATPYRDQTLGGLENGILLLVYALTLACACVAIGDDSSEAAPVRSLEGYSSEQSGVLGWKGASSEFRSLAQSQEGEGERINLTVVVTDAETGQPLNQARLTLEFTEPGDPSKLKRSKKLSYSAKTNAQGHYKFPNLPKGTIRLIVTAERHQTFSKEFEVDKENQAIEIKLKKPQPLL